MTVFPGAHATWREHGGQVLGLERFNSAWRRRAEVFRRRAPPPWWAPGLVVDQGVRACYEAYLPVDEYLRDLGRLARAALPHPSMLPRVLTTGARACLQTGCRSASLPDLWADLPPHLAGNVTLRPEDLFPLLCALASPPRFGTGFGRYPGQTARLSEAARVPSGARARILDLGCGTGQGTIELAAACEGAGPTPAEAVGITLEPLEAWMATHRLLPHDPGGTERFREFRAEVRAVFAAGNVLACPVRGRFDIVVANGIVGGPFLNKPRDVARFLGEVNRLLAPTGIASFGNRFHAGWGPGAAEAMAVARDLGWAVCGGRRVMFLSRGRG